MERPHLAGRSVVRSVLRQDPDVILVGEIRDADTADVACQAAITGHLVLSTLHANDSTTAVTRLGDIGVDRYKVISSLRAVSAQRLTRRLCSCRQPADPAILTESLRDRLRRCELPEQTFAPAGCPACHFSGFAGRVLITEVLEITPSLARVLNAGATAAEVRAKAVASGALETFERDALWHLTEGHCCR